MGKRRGIAVAGLLACMAAGLVLPKTTDMVHAEELEAARPEEGITYVRNDTGDITAINLNGNSVIIKNAPTEEETAPKYYNIYIDKNRNGVVDADESKAVIEHMGGADETDIPISMPIYGLYQAKSTIPLRITVTGAGYGEIVGVCAGEVIVTGDEPAVFMDMDVEGLGRAVGVQEGTVSSVKMSLKGKASNCIGAVSSTVNASGSLPAAILMDINCTNLGVCSAAEKSTVTAAAGVEKAVFVNVRSGQIGNCYGAKEGSINISGNAEAAVSVNVTGGSVGVLYGSCQADVVTAGEGKTALDIAISGNGVVSGCLYAAQAAYSPAAASDSVEPLRIKGDVKLAVTSEADNNVNSSTILENIIDVEGSVIANAEKLESRGGFYLMRSGVTVSGDVFLHIREDFNGYLYGLQGSTVEGNVDFEVIGGNTSNNGGSLYLVNGTASAKDYAVGGNLTITMVNGYVNSFECVNRGGNVKGDLTISALDGSIRNFYGMQSVSVGGDVRITTGENMELTGGYFYGCHSSQIEGSYDIEVWNTNISDETTFYTFYGECSVGKNVTSRLHGGKFSFCNSYGSGTVGGDYISVIEDLEVTSGCYGIYGMEIAGRAIVKMNRIKSSGYTFQGISNGSVGQDTEVFLTDIVHNQQCQGISGGSYKNVQITTGNNQFREFWGIAGRVDIIGNAKIESSGDTAQDGNYTRYYGIRIDSGVVQGNVALTVADCAYKQFYGLYSGRVLGNVNIQVSGGAYTDTVTVCQNSNMDRKGDITANFTGVTFGKEDSILRFENYLGGEGLLTCTVADDCILQGEYTVYNYYSGASVPSGGMLVDIGGDRHYGGTYPITENVTVNNLYFGNGAVMQIPEGITVAVSDSGMICAKAGAMILVEGTLKGSVNQESEYKNGSFYINGGVLETDTEDIFYLYYPLKVDYLLKGGTVSREGCSVHPLSENDYGRVGQTVAFTCTPKKGYDLSSATVKKASEDNPSDMAEDANTSGKYGFDMTKEAAEVKITFTGRQIVLGKTVQDPVVKLNEETTAEKPLYDMEDVTISNDGREGEVAYELDDTFGLPEGLVFADGKIYGTPTKAYEQGKKTVIKITGKNDTVADLTLNIIVTEGEPGQPGQEGRIFVDEANKEINFLGSSVVLENNAGQTAVYLDDNQDGKADREEPVYQGDLSEYTIYGIKDISFRKQIKITMNGGAVKAVYGSMASDITVKNKDAVDIRILGGKVSTEAAGVYDTDVAGTIALTIGAAAECPSSAVQKGVSKYTGYWLNQKGIVSVGGTYTLRESITADEIKLEKEAVFTIPEEVVLTAERTIISLNAALYNEGSLSTSNFDASYSSARLYNNGTFDAADMKVGPQAEIRNKGSLSCTGTFSNSGKLIMLGGSIVQEDNEWPGIYYPITWETELEYAYITCKDAYTVMDEGRNNIFIKGGEAHNASCTKVAGFDAYYIVNDAEPVLAVDGSFSFEMPRQAATLKVIYVPTDIEVKKLFADPIGVAGCEYTEEDPLYDLAGLSIINDTTALYGEEIRYRMANGSALPQGLSLINGKIVGTPKTADEEGRKVRITVTGRNGTSADIELLIKVAADDSGWLDINDVVTYSNSILDLHGHPVVICAARGDSSKTSVYLDENRDGIPDSMAGFKINGSMELNLSGVKVYGCQAEEGITDSTQISIYMRGGKLGELHGCYGTKSSPVTVGEVSVSVTGGTVSYGASGATYASAKIVDFNVTGGTFGKDVYGANMPQNVETVRFYFQNRAEYVNSSGNYALYAVNGGTVTGNVEASVGTDEGYGFSGRNTRYLGVYGAEVNGNVNYTIDGNWEPYTVNNFVYSTTVTGDVNVDWKRGHVAISNRASTLNYAFLRESTVNELNVRVGEKERASGAMSMSVGGTVKNLQYYVPDNVQQGPALTLYNTNSKTTINGYGYGYNRRDIHIAGNYTIKEDLDISNFTILDDAKVTIAKGVTVNSDRTATIGGTLYNQGTWVSGYNAVLNGMIENEGNLRFSSSSVQITDVLTIDTTGMLLNRETGDCYFSKQMRNNGKIVNYGIFSQRGYSHRGSGTMYTTELPIFSGNPANVYYAVSLDYPEYCIDEVAITDAEGKQLASSGIEGDTNRYLKGGSDFTINTGTVIEGITLSKITFGNSAATTSDHKTWTGKLEYEPTVITLNFDGTESISLTKTEDTVTGAEVGVASTADNPLYDMTNIEITGDTEIAGGYVSYTVDRTTPLPEGLSLAKGKIYGTPKKAGSAPQAVKIIVKGKNQTSAVFTLTFDGIAKGTPYLSKPNNLKIDAGALLSTVTLPNYTSPENSAGEYRWKDDTIIAGEAGGTKEIEVEFVPANTTDYDWSRITDGVFADGVVTTTIVLTVNKIAPTFDAPEGLTAVYGQTLGDIVLPEDENGTFSWVEDESVTVGDAGEHTFMLVYTPNNTDKYNTVNNIEVVVTVQPAEAVFTPLESVYAVQGDTLADIILPDAEDGRYQWVTQSSVVPENGKYYQVVFKPHDLVNYNWAAIPGYSNARRGIVFHVTAIVLPYKVDLSKLPAEITVIYGKPLADVKLPYVRNGKWYLDEKEIENPVISAEELPDGAFEWTDGTVIADTLKEMEVKVNFRPTDEEQYTVVENIRIKVSVSHTHAYEGEWITDTDNHWKKCACGQKGEEAAHTWDKGTVTIKPTETEKGERKQTCTVCGKTRIVEVPALGDHEHDYGSTWESDAENHWKECICGEQAEKAAHKWNTGIVTKQPTATEKGERTQTCTVCGKIRVVEEPALGEHQHSYGSAWKSDEESHWKECGCGDITEKAVHTWSAETVTKQPTATEKGEKTQICTVCGKTKVTEIPAAGNTGTGKPAEPGTILKDDVTKAEYKVMKTENGMPQVTYMVSTDKKQSSVTIPESVKLDGISYNVTAIAKNAFKNNKNIKRIVISKTIKTIGDNAFYGCSKLAAVTMGANVETIGKSAFMNCILLKKIVIPKKVKKIGSKAFYGCKKLTNITIKTTKLTTKTVGSKAFTKAGSKNYKKLVVKVPKSKLKAYKKMLWKRGVSRKAKIKK